MVTANSKSSAKDIFTVNDLLHNKDCNHSKK